MQNIVNSLKKINADYIFYAFLFAYFVFAIFFSSFRDAIRDETIYIHETYLIAELLKNGMWIGDYAVGLHGFIFKLPPALIFIFSGSSVWVLTIYNILLGLASCLFFYHFLKKAFNWNATALLVTGVVMANFHFILSIPTYLREMPSLLVTILFFYGIFKNWKPWVIGLILLLLLDAKEYLFLMFGAGYFIWIFLKHFKFSSSASIYIKIKEFFLECFQVYVFSFVWIILMFTTSLIPVNMFLASILTLINSGASHFVNHFSSDTATVNMLAAEGAREISSTSISEDSHPIIKGVLEIFNKFAAYVGKILYPRTFSFLSVPKVILLPAIYMAWKIFKQAWDEKKSSVNNLNLIFPILLFVYLAIYLLRASHGRYLLPIVPLISIYFVYFFYYKYHDLKSLKKVLFATLVFIVGGFFFEISYVPFKILLETFIFVCIAVSVLEPFRFTKECYILFRKFTLAVCVFAMFSASVLFAYAQGQVQRSVLLGSNREIEKIVEIIPDKSKFWINNFESYGLMATYAGQTYEWPEWKWDLAPNVPKKNSLKVYGEKYAYNDSWARFYRFKEYIIENKIEYVVFIYSTSDEYTFALQDRVWDARRADWLELEKVEELKNKRIYLFKVNL